MLPLYVIIISILVVSIGLLVFLNYSAALTSSNITEDHNPASLKYYKCPGKDINAATKTGLASSGFIRGNDPDSCDLYIPCGYNYIELELAKFNPGSSVKYIYAIKGCDQLCSKNGLWSALKTEYGSEQASSIMPLTWLLNDPDDYKEFQRYYLQYETTRPTFILKKNIQGKRGLYITQNKADIDELHVGSKPSGYKVIQRYIDNPYSIQGHKLNIRLYVVIICNAGRVDWYLYNHGKCIYTNKKYDPVTSLLESNLDDKEQHFTSYNLDTAEKYIEMGLPESLDELEKHMASGEYQTVWSRIITRIAEIKDCFAGRLCLLESLADKISFQLFGVDVILDRAMNPLILEFNKGPEMVYKSPGDRELKNNLIINMLAMVMNKKSVMDAGFTIIQDDET